MIRINQIKLDYHADKKTLLEAAAKRLRQRPETILSMTIVRKSIDARKGQIQSIYTVDVDIPGEKAILHKLAKDRDIQAAKPVKYKFPSCNDRPSFCEERAALHEPPVIVGSGPAGLFCGLMLARAGYRPIILERGDEVHERCRQVEHFWKTGELHPNSNVQFGEGGAGTFSDGKLNTLVKDKFGRNKKVLEIFHEAGAPEEILYLNKPHIGTDVLIQVVEHIRNEIIALGGQVHFNAQVTDICLSDGKVCGVEVNHNDIMSTQCLVLAIGHSARDTFEMLFERNFSMSAKPFAVGVRVEHPQTMIDLSQYGRPRDEFLRPAEYKLTHQCKNGRGVYTFCMCPGGYVVNASSEEGATAINGMSYSDRGGSNANSAVIVTVTPEDFGTPGPLAGVKFQRQLEKACYEEALRAGGPHKVPIQQFIDFKEDCPSTAFGEVEPEHRGDVVFANLRRVLPSFICESLIEGIEAFGTKLAGFDRPDALLSGVESRTSSPVRIERDEHLESSFKGIYPCGEGAGYAGGITSAAMDGMKVAEAIVLAFSYHYE